MRLQKCFKGSKLEQKGGVREVNWVAVLGQSGSGSGSGSMTTVDGNGNGSWAMGNRIGASPIRVPARRARPSPSSRELSMCPVLHPATPSPVIAQTATIYFAVD